MSQLCSLVVRQQLYLLGGSCLYAPCRHLVSLISLTNDRAVPMMFLTFLLFVISLIRHHCSQGFGSISVYPAVLYMETCMDIPFVILCLCCKHAFCPDTHGMSPMHSLQNMILLVAVQAGNSSLLISKCSVCSRLNKPLHRQCCQDVITAYSPF